MPHNFVLSCEFIILNKINFNYNNSNSNSNSNSNNNNKISKKNGNIYTKDSNCQWIRMT